MVERKMATEIMTKAKQLQRPSCYRKARSLSSFQVFSQFIKMVDEGETGEDILSEACVQLWLDTRQTKVVHPEESFRRTLIAHIRGAYGRQPFNEVVEASLLKILRTTIVNGAPVNAWERCFPHNTSNIGKRGFNKLGYHEQQREKNSPGTEITKKTVAGNGKQTTKRRRKRKQKERAETKRGSKMDKTKDSKKQKMVESQILKPKNNWETKEATATASTSLSCVPSGVSDDVKVDFILPFENTNTEELSELCGLSVLSDSLADALSLEETSEGTSEGFLFEGEQELDPNALRSNQTRNEPIKQTMSMTTAMVVAPSQQKESAVSPSPDFEKTLSKDLMQILKSFYSPDELSLLNQSCDRIGVPLFSPSTVFFLDSTNWDHLTPAPHQQFFLPNVPVGSLTLNLCNWMIEGSDSCANAIIKRQATGLHVFQLFESALEFLASFSTFLPKVLQKRVAWSRGRVLSDTGCTIGLLLRFEALGRGYIRVYVQDQSIAFGTSLYTPLFL